MLFISGHRHYTTLAVVSLATDVTLRLVFISGHRHYTTLAVVSLATNTTLRVLLYLWSQTLHYTCCCIFGHRHYPTLAVVISGHRHYNTLAIVSLVTDTTPHLLWYLWSQTLQYTCCSISRKGHNTTLAVSCISGGHHESKTHVKPERQKASKTRNVSLSLSNIRAAISVDKVSWLP